METDIPASDAHPPWLLASPTIAAIAGALASAQGEMADAAKDRQNSHFGSSYADLASVVQAVRGPLSKHGIAFIQPASWADGRLVVRTVLTHKSGEWMASELSAKPQQDTPQGIGSTITYLRRYSLMSMTGIAPDDDDGEAGEGRGGQPSKPPARSSPKREEAKPRDRGGAPHHESFTETAQAAFCAAIDDLGFTYDLVAAWCESVKRPRPSAMTAGDRKKVLDYLHTEPGRAAVSKFQPATK